MTAPPPPPASGASRREPRTSETQRSDPSRPLLRPVLRPVPWQLAGLGLFLFIPAVLFLFVVHPAPVIWSVVAGAVLMIGHRRIARPYMTAVAASKCLWCNRVPPRPGGGGELELETRAGVLRPVFCPGHDIPLARFFAFLDAWRWPLRLGIFVPLATLLGALVASAAGRSLPLGAITAGFQLIVGLTVLASAVGYRASAPAPRARVPFPLHNFYLLGVRALLWIFRLVGAWWVLRGARYLLAA